MSPDRLCIECAYHRSELVSSGTKGGPHAYRIHKCYRLLKPEVSLVTGTEVYNGKALDCVEERRRPAVVQFGDKPTHCGQEGMYWERLKQTYQF